MIINDIEGDCDCDKIFVSFLVLCRPIRGHDSIQFGSVFSYLRPDR